MLPFTDRTWLWFAAACYLAGFVLGTVAVIREKKLSRAVMYFIISAGFALQTFGLYQRGLEVKGCPLGNTFELFQFIAWSAIALYLVIGATFRLSLLGYFTSVLAASLTFVSLSFPAWDAARRVNIFGGNAWIEFHAALALFSYGVFALLTLTALMYVLQVFSLKRHHLHGLFSFLPSIRELDHISLRLLTAGVVLLTASLAVGAVYWFDDTTTVNSSKLAITLGVWAAYAAVLILRLRSVLIGKRLAWVILALFAVVLITLPLVSGSHTTPIKASVASAR
ncbi:MAG: cytochrome c biogenesis protein CcsA [Rariglobus sp.]